MAAAVMEGNNSGEGRCKKHFETIQGLCDTCDELVCVKCMMGHHNGHTFTDLEARVGEKMELLQERVQEMRGRVPVLQQRVAELSIQDDKNQRDTEAVIASITQKGRLISLSLSQEKYRINWFVDFLFINTANQSRDLSLPSLL